ncbi:hypothetical protein B0I31_11566 [Saccharothrix carnea]|uniref:Uncharacterized protein n=1 Tax=Saccharothrix carnea TaxID=1280637 RepID=A0A2P8I0X6_SACCR|nr:hypothetical protein [Saccharothrix carnea]PSL52114.1 hypothetical protein B0I31_11566 [Saccharothrix carnea]
MWISEAVDGALAAVARPDEPAGSAWHWSDDTFRAHLPRLSALFLS